MGLLRTLLRLTKLEDVIDLANFLRECDVLTYLSVARDSEAQRRKLSEAVSLLLGPTFDEEAVGSANIDRYEVAVAVALAIIMGRRFVNVLCVRLSKFFEHQLQMVSEVDILSIAKSLGVPVEYSPRECFLEEEVFVDSRGYVGKECYRYRMKVFDYLSAARSLLSEPSWKLVSLPVSEGYVYFKDARRLSRLLAEKYKQLSISCLTRFTENEDVVKLLRDFLGEWSDVLNLLRQSLEEQYVFAHTRARSLEGGGGAVPQLDTVSSVDQLVQVAEKAFPPCMRRLLNSILSGENLTHHERFALATFLINAGLDLELVLEVFRHAPDFNERIARYQIEHLAGLRGSRKKYLTYSCNTMKTLGLCPGSECGVKNPLVYLRRSLRRVGNAKRVGSS